MTRTRQVAAICEVDFIDSVRAYCEGFRSGVKYVNPEAVAVVRYRSGSDELLFHDVEWGRAAALVAVEDGADIVFSVGEETAEAAMAAAASNGALVIGAETDQYPDIPEIRSQLLTSAILDVRAGVLGLLREAVVGGFRGGEFPGEVALAPFHEFDGRVPPEVRTRLQEIADGLKSGDIRIDAMR
jgi:basic membrane protein A